MDEKQFIYFVCLKSNKDLLKKEIEVFHKYLTPSFSKGEFLTYKNTRKSLSVKEIQGMNMAFALKWGENKGKIDNEKISSLLDECSIKIDLPQESPSRAYLKIAEACELFSIKPSKSLNWIEFGSAPGGASYYLLNQFDKLLGVDPAKMDQICLDNERFEHLSKPIQDLSQEMLPDHNIHYITSDLNLNPKQAIKEVIRLGKKYRSLKGILMTIKIVKPEHVGLIPEFEKMFEDAKYTEIRRVQLPSHRREFLIFAEKNAHVFRS